MGMALPQVSPWMLQATNIHGMCVCVCLRVQAREQEVYDSMTLIVKLCIK